MKTINAALAATLVCAATWLCGSAASAQQPAAATRAAPAATQRPQAHAPAAAAPRAAPVYRVELVIFRAVKALGSPEDWAAEAGTAPAAPTDADPGASGESSQAGGVHASTAPPAGIVRLLPSSDFQLDGVAARLRASGRYVPVAHVAWAQAASPWGKPVEIPMQSVGIQAQGITGTVALERGQFLHLALDLRYTMSEPPAGLDAPPGTVFVLDQSHRVRLRERNYFDHPAFGVIAMVTSDEPRRAGP